MPVKLSNPFLLDLRSLSAMRIGIAMCLLVDLAIRSSDLVAHYTDQGVLPLELLFRLGWLPEYFSLYNIGNSPQWTTGVFLVNGICALFLLVGYRTRLASFLCWVLLISLHNRNNMIHQGGDDLLRILLFWGMFLPWNTYFSLDSLRTKEAPLQPPVAKMAGVGYVLLIFSMYFFSALLKNGSDWSSDFTALYYAYQLDMIVLPLGKWLLQYENLLKIFTAITFYLELLIPFALFIPWKVSWWRFVFIILIFGFHLCIASTLFVGLFPMIATTALIGLVPSIFWEKLLLYQVLERAKSRTSQLAMILRSKLFKSPDVRPMPLALWLQRLTTYFLAIIIAFSLYLNYYGVGSYQIDLLEKFRPVVQFLRIDQRWGMFAPIVFREDGWFIFEGTTAVKGRKIDIYNQGKNSNYAKPELVVSMVKNDRWRKYQENILFVNNAIYRPYYCQWLLRTWNQTASVHQQIQRLQMIYIKEISKPNYTTGATSKEMLCECAL